MKQDFARRFGTSLIVARPNGLQYGHLALEMLMALARAREERASVCFLPSGRPVNPALLELESEDVRIMRPAALQRAVLHARWWAAAAPDHARQQRAVATEALYHETGRELSRHIVDKRLPETLRDGLRRWKVGLSERERALRGERGDEPPDFRRRLIVSPIRVALRRDTRERTAALGRELGIAAGAPIVAIHAREEGFKRGMEVHEKHQRLGKSRPRDDATRNARIESYLPAAEYLASRGFTVVRIGDPSMTPLGHPAVIDLATSPLRTLALEVDVLLRSTFLLSGEAGPVGVSYLTNTPVLNVNVTDPISGYPVRASGLCVLKRVVDLQSGRSLSVWDTVGPDHLRHLRDTARFRYEDNTADEILRAVEEMLELQASPPPETDGQQEYRRRVVASAAALRRELSYVQKWGPDDGFLGMGRVARLCLEGRV